MSYQWFVGGKIPMDFVAIEGAVGKVHHGELQLGLYFLTLLGMKLAK